MTATVKPATTPLLAKRLDRLRFQVMAGEMAALVGRNIRLAREQQGRYNHRELAERIRERDPQLAATNQRVSDWERGIQKPNDRYMRLISEILEQPVAWFYERHEPGETPELVAVADPPDVAALFAKLEAIEQQLQKMQRDNEARALELRTRIDERTQPLQAPQRQRRA